MRMDPKQLRIYAVTDKSWLKPGETLEQVVEELLKAGVTCVQLRDKTADDGLLLKRSRNPECPVQAVRSTADHQ